MGNTLLTFIDEHYEYGNSTKIEERGLTIGGYESASLADLVASLFWRNLKTYSKIALNTTAFIETMG